MFRHVTHFNCTQCLYGAVVYEIIQMGPDPLPRTKPEADTRNP